MTKLLDQAFEAARSLPEDAQDHLAERLINEIEELADEKRWEEAFARSLPRLRELAREAEENLDNGLTKPLVPDGL